MATIDYIVASLPALAFGAPAPMTWERFMEIAECNDSLGGEKWRDLETQLRNAMAEARGGTKYVRAANGLSLYWKNRVLACFQERDIAKRDELLDRVWWDAAEELRNPISPLSKGALAAYAVRLKIAIKRDGISKDLGNYVFDRLTAASKSTLENKI